MIQKEFTTKAGVKGIEYKPEHNDEIVCNANSVFVSESRAMIVGKGTIRERAVSIITYGISALWNKKEIFCKLTKGHKTYLDKARDLMGKTLVFENYQNKRYGTLLGVKIKSQGKTILNKKRGGGNDRAE